MKNKHTKNQLPIGNGSKNHAETPPSVQDQGKRQKYINGKSNVIVENVLNREFIATRPNEKWVKFNF
jgi:hypothetical protein